jgi:hypothetical protein
MCMFLRSAGALLRVGRRFPSDLGVAGLATAGGLDAPGMQPRGPFFADRPHAIRTTRLVADRLELIEALKIAFLAGSGGYLRP